MQTRGRSQPGPRAGVQGDAGTGTCDGGVNGPFVLEGTLASLSKLKMYTLLDPDFPLLEIILKATMSPQGLLEDNVCPGNVFKSEKWKTIQMVYQ